MYSNFDYSDYKGKYSLPSFHSIRILLDINVFFILV